VAQDGAKTAPRSPGPLDESRDGPDSHHRFLGVAVRPVQALPAGEVGTKGQASMPERSEPEIWVPISLGQAERVVQQVVGSEGYGSSLVRLLLALGGQDRVVMADLLNDKRVNNRLMSQNVVISLLVLSALHSGKRGVRDIAAELGISTTTAVRYLKTWVAVGILEQDSSTRRYRVALRWRDEFSADCPPQSPEAVRS
jgi:IclR helix-turn-helix domain